MIYDSALEQVKAIVLATTIVRLSRQTGKTDQHTQAILDMAYEIEFGPEFTK